MIKNKRRIQTNIAAKVFLKNFAANSREPDCRQPAELAGHACYDPRSLPSVLDPILCLTGVRVNKTKV